MLSYIVYPGVQGTTDSRIRGPVSIWQVGTVCCAMDYAQDGFQGGPIKLRLSVSNHHPAI